MDDESRREDFRRPSLVSRPPAPLATCFLSQPLRAASLHHSVDLADLGGFGYLEGAEAGSKLFSSLHST